MSEEDMYELEQELKLNKQESWRLSDLAYERQQKIEKLSKINKKLKNELQQKENIIKEVREYIEENTILLDYYLGEHRKVPKLELIGENYNKLKEILDKVGDDNEN